MNLHSDRANSWTIGIINIFSKCLCEQVLRKTSKFWNAQHFATTRRKRNRFHHLLWKCQ